MSTYDDKGRTKEALRLCEEFVTSYNRRTQRHITFEPTRTIIHASDKDKVYIPSPTCELLHATSSFVNLIMGPYGSGKTTACLQHIVRTTCKMARWYNGRR